MKKVKKTINLKNTETKCLGSQVKKILLRENCLRIGKYDNLCRVF